jgi:hypothetical protein
VDFSHQSKIENQKSKINTVYPLRYQGPDNTPTPFPTIYWLADADLDRRLADLERLGHIRRIEQRLAEEDALRQAVHADHDAYRAARWARLTPEDRRVVEASASLSRAFRGGVGGTANPDTVKCLHAHYAHHLAAADRGGTTLGRLIDPLLYA